MKTIKVSEATNLQLDWLVAKCEGARLGAVKTSGGPKAVVLNASWDGDVDLPVPTYTTDPSQMWPIIDREGIGTDPKGGVWSATRYSCETPEWAWMNTQHGETSLIAAARCYVISKLGETVEVPEELT